jgi:hypothetical protein
MKLGYQMVFSYTKFIEAGVRNVEGSTCFGIDRYWAFFSKNEGDDVRCYSYLFNAHQAVIADSTIIPRSHKRFAICSVVRFFNLASKSFDELWVSCCKQNFTACGAAALDQSALAALPDLGREWFITLAALHENLIGF